VLYPHFWVEHNRGHHVRVATDDDPASAARGEALYPFWARSISGGVASAWRLDRRFCGRAWLGCAAALAAVAVGLGMVAALAWVGVALVAVLLLETVNYVEHYGLRRARGPDGRWERVGPRHSWNSEHALGRALLFDLTRHADHHAHATRPFHGLRRMEDAPALPTGYPGMILLSLLPPAFFAVMDRRL
jgi:alkane 1-monooxygenase